MKIGKDSHGENRKNSDLIVYMEEIKQNLQNEITQLKEQIADNEALLADSANDTELTEMAKTEIEKLQSRISELEDSIATLNGNFATSESEEMVGDGINPNYAILEIRAGAGGSEAALFAADLYYMYSRYCEKVGWKMTRLNDSFEEKGGLKSISAEIKGKEAYTKLKNESGVHRVQRVPETESSGRIHTSTATVAVLPKVSPVQVEIRPDDVKMDFFRASGSGGQNVNKVSTAVRLTHQPTGVVVECQEERTQGKNREKAMEMLRSRLFQAMQDQKVQQIADLRLEQVGTGERNEKIRTYNFPQDRVTDHRLGKNWGNLAGIMGGDLDRVFDLTIGIDS